MFEGEVHAGRCKQRPYVFPALQNTSRTSETFDLHSPATESLPRIFDRANGKQWDYVFNCGGETRYSQEDEVYKVRSLALSVAVGNEAARRGVKVFVELSTGMVYKPDSQPSKEGDKTKPWSKIAVFKLQAEEQLSKIEGYVSQRGIGVGL